MFQNPGWQAWKSAIKKDFEVRGSSNALIPICVIWRVQFLLPLTHANEIVYLGEVM